MACIKKHDRWTHNPILWSWGHNNANEPRHEKTCLCHIRTTKCRSACASTQSDQHCCLDSVIPLVSISEISSLYLASVAAQASLCLTWSQTLKKGFLVTRWISLFWHSSKYERNVCLAKLTLGVTHFASDSFCLYFDECLKSIKSSDKFVIIRLSAKSAVTF